MKYILTIVGIVFLGVMIDVIAPEGKMNAFIKSIFSIFLLFAIVSPVVDLFSGNKITKLFNSEFTLNNEYLDDVNEMYLTSYENIIIEKLEEEGFYGVLVEIKGNMTDQNKNIEKVTVNTENIVLTNTDNHINKYEVITELIKDILKVESEVIIYE